MTVLVLTPTGFCQSCMYVKRYLDKRNIPYEARTMTADERDEFYHNKGFRAFPVVIYNGRAFSGMGNDNLERLVRDYRYFTGDSS